MANQLSLAWYFTVSYCILCLSVLCDRGPIMFGSLRCQSESSAVFTLTSYHRKQMCQWGVFVAAILLTQSLSWLHVILAKPQQKVMGIQNDGGKPDRWMMCVSRPSCLVFSAQEHKHWVEPMEDDDYLPAQQPFFPPLLSVTDRQSNGRMCQAGGLLCG